MSTATFIPVGEYLSSTYQPDRDFVDGDLQERSMGELSHGVLQGLLVTLFNINRRAWQVFAGTEVRVQINEERYRVPDVCVMRSSDPFEPIVHTAPLICIEVLSPEDRMQRMQERTADYASLGVENIWLINPLTRQAWTATPDGSQTRVEEQLMVPGTPIRVSLRELFAELDEIQFRG